MDVSPTVNTVPAAIGPPTREFTIHPADIDAYGRGRSSFAARQGLKCTPSISAAPARDLHEKAFSDHDRYSSEEENPRASAAARDLSFSPSGRPNTELPPHHQQKERTSDGAEDRPSTPPDTSDSVDDFSEFTNILDDAFRDLRESYEAIMATKLRKIEDENLRKRRK
ncbi:hypothetical protein BDV06DRAFT_226044 [Aspergillus oleicola]